jgi:hypothetical protein
MAVYARGARAVGWDPAETGRERGDGHLAVRRKARRGGGDGGPLFSGGVPHVPPAHLESWVRSEEMDGWRAGDTVRLDGEPGATFRVKGFTDPGNGGKPWADLYGGQAGCGQWRSVALDRLRDTRRKADRTRADRAPTREKTAPGGSQELADAVRLGREALGWTRGALAEATGLHYGLLTRIEAGTRGVSDDERAALGAAIELGVTA